MVEINKEEIMIQVSEVIHHSQAIDNPIIDELIEDWFKNKSWLIEKLNGLIYEHPKKITIELDENSKQDKLFSFLNFVDVELQGVLTNDYCCDLLDFIYSNKKNFFTNKTEEVYVTPKLNITIPKGIKIIKAFKFFFNEEQKDYLNIIQSKASMIIQENKIEGTLCFSIHPLDYLSSSENTYNWRSCHALDGEYCAGNLSYMADPSTIVCYLKSDKMEKLPHFPDSVPWNSKKWRMLLHLTKDLSTCYAGRQYPFFSKPILEEIRCIFLQGLMDNYTFCPQWSAWHCDQISDTQLTAQNSSNNESELLFLYNHIPIKERIYCLRDLIKEPRCCLHYNDILLSSCYKPYYCWRNSFTEGNRVVSIGHDVKCVKCGKDYICGSNGMLCEACGGEEDVYYCASCDCRINSDVYWLDWETYGGETVCESCFNSLVTQCEHCHRLYYTGDNIIQKNKNGILLCGACETTLDELSKQTKPKKENQIFNLLISQGSSEFQLADMAYGVIVE